MNILKVEFYPPIKRQPYLRKHFVKILNYRNKNTEIQCKFKTRRFIKTDKMKFYITNGTQGKQMPYRSLSWYSLLPKKNKKTICYHQECLVYLGVWLLSGCHLCSKQILFIIVKSAGN